jgi:8-oxo-dGTP diphosphatase
MRRRAAAIILKGGSVLLIRRQKPGRDYYILPGGGVELDESFPEACIREVKEETGFDVLGLQLVRVYFNNGNEEHYFLARVAAGEPVLGGPEARRQSPENLYSFEWVASGQLANLNLLPVEARRICLEVMGR